MKKKRSTKLRWIGLALAGLGSTLSGAAMAGMQVESDGGLKVYDPADSAYWFSVGGRMDFDETIFSGSYFDKGSYYPSGANIRRVFLKVMGGVGDYWSYNFTGSFAGNLVDFEDAWINYAGFCDNTNVRVGQFTPLASIDDWGNFGTINDTLFLESALATTAFSVPQKAIGLWIDSSFVDMFTLAGVVYQPRQNNTTAANNAPGNQVYLPNTNTAITYTTANNYQNPTRSDRLGTAMRLTFSPVHCDETVYHLGVLGRFQSMNNTMNGVPVYQTNLFATTPEALARNTAALLNTGNVRARSYNIVNGEALAIWGPLMFEAEYYQANVQRVPTINDPTNVVVGNVRFHGWHGEASYILTGESRGYDFATGTVQNPSPCSPCGAWELAVRYSYLTLNDKNIYGGTEHNATFGINYFPNDNIRIGANYIRANIHNTNPLAVGTRPTTGPVKRQLDIFGLRVGVEF